MTPPLTAERLKEARQLYEKYTAFVRLNLGPPDIYFSGGPSQKARESLMAMLPLLFEELDALASTREELERVTKERDEWKKRYFALDRQQGMAALDAERAAGKMPL